MGSEHWSIDDLIDEVQFHINGLRSIILGHEMHPRPCPEISRTLSFCMSELRDRREELVREKHRLDAAEREPVSFPLGLPPASP